MRTKVSDELLHHAIDALYRLEEFGEGGEMLHRTVDRLDQWVKEQKPIADWKPDPMIATLPDSLMKLPEVENLGKLEFDRSDGVFFQEVVWLRDASNWARGEDVEDVARAKGLFDWTVRNVQLEWDRGGPAGPRILQTPWETLLLGRGTALERAWVFILLARQQGLDAALLAIPDRGASSGQGLKPWVVGVLSEGQLYLFDPELGMPIPGPDGVRLNEDGQLDIQPATLSQVAADDALLRNLDLDAGHPYPVEAKQLQDGVVVLLEASPPYLQQRMRMVEARLTGAEKMVLTTDPSSQADRFKQSEHVADARLWTMPYAVVAQRSSAAPQVLRWQLVELMPFRVGQSPALWKGRILHLKGELDGEVNATMYYQLARPSDRELAAAEIEPALRGVYARAKQNASYWLGLIAYDQNNYRSAIDYLANRTLDASENSPWARGAHYNLGRVYEADRQYDKALAEFRTKTPSPDHRGNLLRARWLESQTQTRAESSKTETAGSDGQ
jgi:tetratricopeptide (TPR) repeat protein